MNDVVVNCQHLTRQYGRGVADVVLALDNVDFQIRKGTVHGLLGPNGAGKTSLCRILSTAITPTSGTATVSGFDVVKRGPEVRSRVSVCFGGERGLYTALSARENLEVWGALQGVQGRALKEKISGILGALGLSVWGDRVVKSYSRGMKQRVHIGRALISDPDLLILDEPTAGLDPASAVELRDVIKRVRSEGRSILLATHDLREAETICDEVTVIDGGRIILNGAPSDLIRQHRPEQEVVLEVPAARSELVAALREMALELKLSSGPRAGTTRIEFRVGTHARLWDVLRCASMGEVHGLTVRSAGLDEVYLQQLGARGMHVIDATPQRRKRS